MANRERGSGTGVYVIDQAYRIVYANDVFFREYPQAKIGSLCYEAVCQKDRPCEACPAAGGANACGTLYDQGRGRWVEVGSGRIDWPGAGECHIVMLSIGGRQDGGDGTALPVTLAAIYGADAFYRDVEALLARRGIAGYCMMAVDIERFQLFNEWYGQAAGDEVLSAVAACLLRQTQAGDAAAGYFGDDDFAVFLPMDARRLKALQEEVSGAIRHGRDSAVFLPAFGIYECKGRDVTVPVMYERATLAMAAVKGSCTKRVCWYDDSMLRRDEEYSLLTEVRQALENQEFTFYIQPQYNVYSGKVVGAESLVRWNHRTRGLVLPGEFIPFLERTGFIADLDRYVWEQVCIRLRGWIDRGKRPVPISINLSQVDFYAMDVAEQLIALTGRYNIPTRLLEVEITESVYVGDYLYITGVVDRLRAAGFPVLMDDFGSGYSSLNMLKNVNLDALKIDAKFLELTEENAGRGEDIVEAVLHMARLMNLSIVVEGVETRTQLEFLQDLGCRYAQGYYFNRPMSIEDFEAHIGGDDALDPDGFQSYRATSLHLQELLSQRLLSETMLNNLIGAMAVYDVHGRQVSIQQANGLYDQMVAGFAGSAGYHRRGALAWIGGEDWDALLDLFHRARQRPFKGLEGDVRCVPAPGREVWLRLRLVFLQEQNGHSVYYSTVQDVTGLHKQARLLESAQRSLATAAGDESFMRLTEENRRVAAAISAQMTMGGMIGGYCEDGFPLYFANAEMVRFLGYSSYEDLAQGIGYMVQNTIHPDDRSRVAEDIGPEYYVGLEYVTAYRMPKKNGVWFWTLDRGQVIRAEDGRMAIVSACTDISDVMLAQKRLAERNADLLRRNQELQFFNSDMPGCYHRCADTPEFDFLYISELFLKLFGYTKEEIEYRFDNKFLNMVHPEDRDLVVNGTQALRERTGMLLEYRMLAKDGYIWVIDQTRQVTYQGQSFYHGMVVDVTETVELRDRMKLLMKYAPENILLFTWRDGAAKFQVISNGLRESYGEAQVPWHDEESLRGKLRERLEWNICSVMAERGNYREIFPVEQPDGGSCWISIDASYVGQERGGITYLCIFRDVTDLKSQEERLRLTSQRLESTLRLADLNSWDWDLERDTLTLLNVSQREWIVQNLPEARDGEAVIQHFSQWLLDAGVMAPSYIEQGRAEMRQLRQVGTSGKKELEVPLQSDGGRWLRISFECVKDSAGTPVRVIGYYTDITEEKLRSRASEEKLQVLEMLGGQAAVDFQADLTDDVILHKGSDLPKGGVFGAGDLCYTDTVGRIAQELVAGEDRAEFLRFTDRERLIQAAQDQGQMENLDYRGLDGGAAVWMRAVIYLTCQEKDGRVRAHLFIMNIDAQKRQELRLTQMAETDALTGLYNRHRAIPEIREYLAHQPEGEQAALIMFDLDNFKQVNDVYGHAYGDTLISTMARRIRQNFREGDIVCRFGGDEFLVLCKRIDQSDIRRKLRSIVHTVTIAYDVKGKEFCASVSAGYVTIPDQGRDFEDLCVKADTAMFAAKLAGKNAFRRYEPSMRAIRHELGEKPT